LIPKAKMKEEIKKDNNFLSEEEEEIWELNKTKCLSVVEMIFFFQLAPLIIAYWLRSGFSDEDLEKENYLLKIEQRKRFILGGFICWIIVFLY
jgi:hypothetical protein